MSSEVNISDPAVRAELDKLNKLDGGVPFRASTQHAHHTWARTFHSSPELYIQPESLAEVEKAITLARRCRKRITTVGCGHSPSDMTCTSSWMMNLDKFNKILDVNPEKNLVTMEAGIRLYQLGAELDKLGLAMPNLGSINDQSIAGAISTGTHGSTLRHSILSSSVTSLKITLANSRTLHCTPDENEELFRAALCSLGALGVITEITFQAVPAFTLHWSQTVYPDSHMLDNWNKDLWTQAEFVRVWWFPYTRRSTVWKASKTDESPEKMPYKPSYYDTKFGYTIYHNLLYVAHYIPRILPWVEWFVFGMQYGFSTGPKTTQEAVQPSREALLMNCLYSQYVNEWALPLKNGPEALRRLSSWLNHLKPTDKDYVEHRIPFSAKGLWVHAPIEVRVSDTTVALKNQDGTPRKSARPYLDTTCNDGPTLYLNATLYRPYNMDPPCRITYYQGFEHLMRELGGKPHWAKNFEVTGEQIAEMYGNDLTAFRKVRDEADPEGLFTGPWHRRYLLASDKPRLELEEVESTRRPLPTGGVEVFGSLPVNTEVADDADYVKKPVFDEVNKVEEVRKEAAAAKVAVSKALQDSEDLRMRLQKKVEDKLAREAAEKAEKARLGKIAAENAAADIKAEAARVQAIEDECVRKAKLQKVEDDKKAEEARLKKIEGEKAEQARLHRIEDDKIAADAAAEKSRIQKEEEDRAAADAAAFVEAQEQERIQTEQVEKQRRASWEAHEKQRIRLLKEKDELAAKQARDLELKQQEVQELKLKQEREEAARIQAAKDEEALRLRKESEARELEVRREAEDRELKLKQEMEEAARVQAAKDQELRMKREAEARELELKEQQEAQAAKDAEALRLKQESEAKQLKLKEEREEAARVQAAKDAEELRLKQESEAKAAKEAQELKLKQEREEAARVQAAKEAEALRLKQQAEAIKAQVEEQKRKDELVAAELKKTQDTEAAATRAESERLKKIEEERIAAERESKRVADEKARVQREKEAKEESDRLAAIEAQKRQEEAERQAAIKAKKDEEGRLAAIAKKEEDERLEREANVKRQDEERVRLERQEANRKRLAEEKAQKERELAERRRIAEEERLAAVEKKKKDDEHNAKLAAAEAQRLKEEAAERHAQRQQQLKEAQEAREREEYEKRMVAEHNRREAAKAEAILRELDEKDRIARVEHDNQVRLEKGRLAREAKEREDRLERERLAEDARQIQKRHEVEEKRKRIQEKKELQRIEIQRKQAERREAAAAKKAIEDEAAKKAQEERAVQQQAEADEKAKKAKEIREAFKAQIAARAAQAAAEAEKQKQSRPETPASSKGRRSLSPKTNGASSRPATPAAKAKSPAKEKHKPTTFAEAVKEDLPTESTGASEKSENVKKATPNSPKAPTSPKAQRIFRPSLGTPTPSVLLAKREGLEPTAGSPAQKRIKLEELIKEPLVGLGVSRGEEKETTWKPQSRPNSLDELLAQQEREREEEEKKN